MLWDTLESNHLESASPPKQPPRQEETKHLTCGWRRPLTNQNQRMLTLCRLKIFFFFWSFICYIWGWGHRAHCLQIVEIEIQPSSKTTTPKIPKCLRLPHVVLVFITEPSNPVFTQLISLIKHGSRGSETYCTDSVSACTLLSVDYRRTQRVLPSKKDQPKLVVLLQEFNHRFTDRVYFFRDVTAGRSHTILHVARYPPAD